MTRSRGRKFHLGILSGLIILGVAFATLGSYEIYQAKNNHLVPHEGSVAAIDSANVITDPQWFKKAYSLGIRLYILQSTSWGSCTPWPRAEAQAQMALDAGIKIAAYTRNPTCWHNGIMVFGNLKNNLQFFALDIESDPGIPLTPDMIEGVTNLGVKPVVYTGAGMWPNIMKNSSAFSSIPLWETDTSSFSLSHWDINYLAPPPHSFDGWNTPSAMRIGVQQQFEYSLNGVKVDLNSFNVHFLK